MISSFCSGADCVDVEFADGFVYVSGTREPGILAFTSDEWAAFVAGVKVGQFDLEEP